MRTLVSPSEIDPIVTVSAAQNHEIHQQLYPDTREHPSTYIADISIIAPSVQQGPIDCQDVDQINRLLGPALRRGKDTRQLRLVSSVAIMHTNSVSAGIAKCEPRTIYRSDDSGVIRPLVGVLTDDAAPFVGREIIEHDGVLVLYDPDFQTEDQNDTNSGFGIALNPGDSVLIMPEQLQIDHEKSWDVRIKEYITTSEWRHHEDEKLPSLYIHRALARRIGATAASTAVDLAQTHYSVAA